MILAWASPFNPFSAGTYFNRDVRFWRPKSIPEMKE